MRKAAIAEKKASKNDEESIKIHLSYNSWLMVICASHRPACLSKGAFADFMMLVVNPDTVTLIQKKDHTAPVMM